MRVSQEVLEQLEGQWKEVGGPIVMEGETKENLINALSVEEVGYLKPHEETHLYGKLKVAEGILKEKKFTWPIFCDKNTGVIMDGMHRWNLLKDFCFMYVPVQHIDYLNNDNIILDVWCRDIKEVREEEFQLAAREVGLEEVSMSHDEIEKRDQAIIISPNNRSYIFRDRMGPKQEFYKLKEIEDRFGIGRKVEAGLADYSVEHKVMELISEPRTVVIFPRPLSKQDVVDVAIREEVFPPKTTRHIFQFRVFNINVMPDDLQHFKSHEMLAQKLREVHKKKPLSYIGKGINIDRYYEEHMFRFD